MLAEVEELLDYSREQIDTFLRLHIQSVRARALIPGFRPLIKNILENQRSALDYTAQEIVKRWGTPGGKVYWPGAVSSTQFPGWFDVNMPGVARRRPDIRDEIRVNQPYQPKALWLKNLIALTNENKHRNLTEQHTYEQSVYNLVTPDTEFQGWFNFRIVNGAVVGDEARDRPEVAHLSYDPTSNRVTGMRPNEAVRRLDLFDWIFTDLNQLVTKTVVEISGRTRRAVHEVSSVAGL